MGVLAVRGCLAGALTCFLSATWSITVVLSGLARVCWPLGMHCSDLYLHQEEKILEKLMPYGNEMVEKSKLVNKEVEEIIYFLCNCNGGKNWTCKKLKWYGK